jgi:hypothetical protein
LRAPRIVKPDDLLGQIQAYHVGLIEKGEEWSTANARRFIESHCKVIDPAGQLVQFNMNLAQERVWEVWCALDDAGLPVFLFILKIRKTGISTFIELVYVVKAYTLSHRNMLVAAHVTDSSNSIYGIPVTAWKSWPQQIKDANPLKTGEPTAHGLAFSNGTTLRVGTAGSTQLARGETLQDFHGSEVAYWPNPSEIMNAVGNAMAAVPGNSKILETTANGEGNWTHRTFMAAQRGENEYRSIFLGLKEFPSYVLLPPPKPLILRQDELEYQKLHGLSDELSQAVAHKKRSPDCDNSWRLFKREFPGTVEEAFAMSADFVFDHEALNWMSETHVRDPLYRCNLEWDGEMFGSAITPHKKTENPLLEVWLEPEPQEEYVVFLDTSEGIGSDYSVGQAFLVRRGKKDVVLEQAAKLLSNRTLIWDIGVEVFKLAQWYNWAFLGSESNAQGLLICQNLEHGFAGVSQAETPYPYLYYSVTQNKRLEKRTERVGWLTTPGRNGTKRLMIGTLQKAIYDKAIIYHSARTVLEHKGFYFDPISWNYSQRNEDELTKLCHDDEVMSCAGGKMILKQYLEAPRLMGKAKSGSF